MLAAVPIPWPLVTFCPRAKEKIEELEGIKFDMLMFGKQAIDGDTAQVGPQVAEDLDIPQVTYAWEVWPTEDGKSVRVKKELEEGFEILEMACPVRCDRDQA